MSARIAIVGVVVASLSALASLPARAADYPFSGYFANADSADAGDAANLRKCALSFFKMEKDGSFLSFHLDLAGYAKTKQVHFTPYNKGACRFYPDKKLESCTIDFDVDPENMKTYVDQIVAQQAGRIDTAMFDPFDTKAEADSFAATLPTRQSFPVSYLRCPFDDAKAAAALEAGMTKLPAAEVLKIIAPDDAALADPAVDDVLARLK